MNKVINNIEKKNQQIVIDEIGLEDIVGFLLRNHRVIVFFGVAGGAVIFGSLPWAECQKV